MAPNMENTSYTLTTFPTYQDHLEPQNVASKPSKHELREQKRWRDFQARQLDLFLKASKRTIGSSK